MGKVRLCPVISEQTMKNLKVFIVNKQGDFKKGDISKWVEIAINNLTAGYGAHAPSTHNANPYLIPKGRLKVRKMMENICKQWIQSGLRLAPINAGNTTIPIKHLDQMIREVTGYHDPRAIKNHMQDLIKYDHITDKGYSGAFLILDTGSDIEWIEGIMGKEKQREQIDSSKHTKTESLKQQREQEFNKIV